jgi:HEAT repeats
VSDDFERFERSLHHSGRRDDEAFDLDALERLSGAERERAEEMLTSRLRGGDHRAVEALAVLSTPSALEALRDAVTSARGEVLASLARWLSRSDPEAARETAFRALRSDDDSVRVGGVQALGDLPGDDIDSALLAAVDDPVSEVRFFTTRALFERLGLSRCVVPRRGLTMLRMRLTSEFESLWRPAFAELTTLIGRLRAGDSPEALGLVEEKPVDSPALQAWVQSIRSDIDERPYTEDFDLAALGGLSAEDRAWAELALIGRLSTLDPRVPRALRHLKSRQAVEPMRVVQRRILDGAPSWLERPRRFVEELARALEVDDSPGDAND